MPNSAERSKRIIRNRASAEYLGISIATYWRLVARGELPQPVRITSKIGGQPQSVLDDFIGKRTAQ